MYCKFQIYLTLPVFIVEAGRPQILSDKEIKGTMIKEINESIMAISHQVENINTEIEFIKKTTEEIMKLENK